MKRFRNVTQVEITCNRCGVVYPLRKVVTIWQNDNKEKLMTYSCPVCDKSDKVGAEWKPINRK